MSKKKKLAEEATSKEASAALLDELDEGVGYEYEGSLSYHLLNPMLAVLEGHPNPYLWLKYPDVVYEPVKQVDDTQSSANATAVVLSTTLEDEQHEGLLTELQETKEGFRKILWEKAVLPLLAYDIADTEVRDIMHLLLNDNEYGPEVPEGAVEIISFLKSLKFVSQTAIIEYSSQLVGISEQHATKIVERMLNDARIGPKGHRAFPVSGGDMEESESG